MKIIIIEDEPFAVKRLKELILSIEPSWEILDVFDDIENSVNWLKSNSHPDLIFMDIQLSDGFSFDIFNQVKIKSKIIFITAFDNYAIQAFRHNGLDYLLKPVKKNLLEESITRFKTLKNESIIDYESLSSLISKKEIKYKKRFLTKTGDQLNFIDTEKIAYFISESSYSILVSKLGNQYILDGTLDSIESQLNPNEFYRINRKQIIALTSIKTIKNYFNNRLILTLTPTLDEDSIVSRTKAKNFKEWLDS
jgi:DNA-binding LytR/AlgR family response regulator